MIEIGKKYGCLTVLDNGEEYRTTEKYFTLIDALLDMKSEVEPYVLQQKKLISDNPKLYKRWKECMESHCLTREVYDFHDKICTLSEKIQWKMKDIKALESKTETHYKCQCKCGKIHYYNATTLENSPRFCCYPIALANTCNYSNRAKNATYRKREKYEALENVRLWEKSHYGGGSSGWFIDSSYYSEEKDQSLPSEEYCELYNRYKNKELLKKEQEKAETVSQLPRVYAKNYDKEYEGRQYESLHIEECVNDHLESEPRFSFNQRHNKIWHAITVYKQYRCKCTLCGKEKLITCDKFGIYPPTEYGYHAYFGYWSEAFCECHPISSFQWIVCKILFEAGVRYTVEYSFPDLYVASSNHPLRFDFAVFDADGNIDCLIECQGEQHYKAVDEFGGEIGLQKQKEYDDLKRKYVTEHKIKLIEIPYKDKKYDSVYAILVKHGIVYSNNSL